MSITHRFSEYNSDETYELEFSIANDDSWFDLRDGYGDASNKADFVQALMNLRDRIDRVIAACESDG